jgi:hypothetical protein
MIIDRYLYKSKTFISIQEKQLENIQKRAPLTQRATNKDPNKFE